MAKIKFDRQRCKGCGLCVLFCPMKVLRMSPNLNAQGQPYPDMADEARCTTCGMCFRMCPDGAIEVTAGEAEKCPNQENQKSNIK